MEQGNDKTVEPKETDLMGRQLGGFRLLRRLGQGAMAEVYLAEQISLKRQVALKILKSRLAEDETYVRRFQREAQAAAALVHANIVQIHEVGQIDGVHYIAQEYVQGLNLRQWLARNGPPDLRLALLIMRQVAAALAKAAEQGIVHRDIKPENIMLTRTGEVKVADFGLARILREGGAVDLTEFGITLGTPLYMSPEQVEGKLLDPRSDIYSFGVTCYQMLAGCPPFSGETALSVALQHAKKQPDPLENHRRDLPAALCRVVHKMLAKSPEGRYESAIELLRDLRRIQTAHLGEDWPEDGPLLDLPPLATIPLSIAETTQRLDALMKTAAGTAPRRPRWIFWAAAILLALILGGSLALLAPHRAPLLPDSLASSIPHFDTIARQYWYAGQVETPEAWQAVIDYLPRDSTSNYWSNRAVQQLARLYLRNLELDRALDKFKELAALDDTEQDLKAFGLAGQAVALTWKGQYDESAKVVFQLLHYRSRLRDPVISQMLRDAIEANQRHLGQTSDPTSEKWKPVLQEFQKALGEQSPGLN